VCGQTPKGNFVVHIGAYNLTDTWEVLDYRSTSINEWKHYAFNLGNLVDNETVYELAYWLDIEDHYNPYCIYLDGVKLVPTFAITEEECISECSDDPDKYGLYRRATWDEEVCIYEDEYLSPVCMTAEDYGDVTDPDRGWICDPDDPTTKMYWDSPQLEWVRIPNSTECIQEAIDKGLILPEGVDTSPQAEYVKGWLDQVVGFLINLFPGELAKACFFIGLMIAAAGVVVWKTESWQIAMIVAFALALLGAFVGWLPFWIAIVFIILSAFAMARMVIGGLE